MCVELTQSPMAVLILQDNANVLVNGVRVIFSAKADLGDSVYFTTEDSDHAGLEKATAEIMADVDPSDPYFSLIERFGPETIYADYVKHVRRKGSGVGMYTRLEFLDMFKSGDFEIA